MIKLEEKVKQLQANCYMLQLYMETHSKTFSNNFWSFGWLGTHVYKMTPTALDTTPSRTVRMLSAHRSTYSTYNINNINTSDKLALFSKTGGFDLSNPALIAPSVFSPNR
ncbi:hypothetical protein TNCV_4752951 [Trichonephila clavipes]|nr:hypothetical protein TNCV_4752951 [Trichonephila clavipes]